ncbi:MAG: CAP domain-containing protein [Ruminococcus sp.]|nr:CAP domain-containing protein [Ruminococcus sp.]
MPIKVNCKNIERIIKTDTSGQLTEIMKVYRNNAVVWTKKSPYTPEQIAKMADNVAYLLNKERAALGLNQLYVVPYLNECAAIRAKEQVEAEGHYRPNGDRFTTVIDPSKLPWLSMNEILALGTSSAEDTVKAWKNSQINWKAATSDSYTHTGIAGYYDENSKYKWNWVQIFTNDVDPTASYPGQYLPQYTNLYDKFIIKCVDSETGENISGITFVLYTNLSNVKTSDFSATQNGADISVPTFEGMLNFNTGKFPTEISGIPSCELKISISKSSLRMVRYTYSRGLDKEDSSMYFSSISVRNNYETHEFTVVLTKQY